MNPLLTTRNVQSRNRQAGILPGTSSENEQWSTDVLHPWRSNYHNRFKKISYCTQYAHYAASKFHYFTDKYE